MKTIILETLISANENLKKSTTHAPSRRGFFLIPLILVCIALCQQVQSATDTPDPRPVPATNTADGHLALAGLTTGAYNSAFGIYSLLSLTDGNFCTGVGAGALFSNTASENTATGAGALLSNTIGEENTANGAFALFSNTEGDFNTANGSFALFGNTTGERNTATGDSALFNNNTGSRNTANGNPALGKQYRRATTTRPSELLRCNPTRPADQNTATGVQALSGNTAGIVNTATGYQALASNTDGTSNTATGVDALQDTTTGGGNTATGYQALLHNDSGDYNTAIGLFALGSLTTGSNNTGLGRSAGTSVTTADHVICIGDNVSGANVSNSCYIGSIFGQTSSGGAAVFINNSGKLGTTTSSRRFKEDIKRMDTASEALFALQPVTFRYKKEIDPQSIPQFGLVAEDVEKVNPDLVVRDKEGKLYSVRYEAVNAMLLNEFLKEHRKVQEQEAMITQLKKDFRATVVQLTTRLDEQAAQIQNVSAQLEVSKPAPQVVDNL